MTGLRVYVEQGRKRAYAGVIAWPGWDRGGRDEQAALEALAAAGPRYVRAVGRTLRPPELPASVSDLVVVEHVPGDASTDFGIPAIGPSADNRPVTPNELDDLIGILTAAWTAFDAAAEAARGQELRKGPRGGGRELGAIQEHVLGGERAYLRQIGGRRVGPGEGDPAAAMAGTRAAVREAITALAGGQPVDVSGRRTARLWTPRYFVRRSAWHALDHAWEIEDRVSSA